MSTRHPVPAEALDKHIAILGKTGSGKDVLVRRGGHPCARLLNVPHL